MTTNTVYCEECVEEIPNDECYWDEKRLYCGRCGSEIYLAPEATDVLEEMSLNTTSKARQLLRLDDEDDLDEEGDEDDFEEDEFEDDEEEEKEKSKSKDRD